VLSPLELSLLPGILAPLVALSLYDGLSRYFSWTHYSLSWRALAGPEDQELLLVFVLIVFVFVEAPFFELTYCQSGECPVVWRYARTSLLSFSPAWENITRLA
jgi:hypothetical protein